MALTVSGIKQAAEAILANGREGLAEAKRHTNQQVAKALLDAYDGHHEMFTLRNRRASDPPPPTRHRQLLEFAKVHLDARLHGLIDQAANSSTDTTPPFTVRVRSSRPRTGGWRELRVE